MGAERWKQNKLLLLSQSGSAGGLVRFERDIPHTGLEWAYYSRSGKIPARAGISGAGI